MLLRGASGWGKSDLAFRMVADGLARLVADDRVIVDPPQEPGGAPMLRGPESLAGRIEVRGLGIITLEARECCGLAPLRLVVDLVARADVPRLPMADPVYFHGAAIPRLRLHGFDASTPLKIARALALVTQTAGTMRDATGLFGAEA